MLFVPGRLWRLCIILLALPNVFECLVVLPEPWGCTWSGARAECRLNTSKNHTLPEDLVVNSRLFLRGINDIETGFPSLALGGRLLVEAGGFAELQQMVLKNATLPASGGMLPEGLEVAGGGEMHLVGTTIELQHCEQFFRLRDSLCDNPDGPPLYAEVLPTVFYLAISWVRLPGLQGTVVYEGVRFVCSLSSLVKLEDALAAVDKAAAQALRTPACSSKNITNMSELLGAATYLSMAVGKVFLNLNESVYSINPAAATLPISPINAQLTIRGVLASPDAPLVEINWNGSSSTGLIPISSAGVVHWHNVAFVNLPPGSPGDYPMGALTALFWPMDFTRRALPNRLRTRCTNCLYHIPEEEAAWWAYWMQSVIDSPSDADGTGNAAWVSRFIQTIQGVSVSRVDPLTPGGSPQINITAGFVRAQFRSWELINCTLASGLPTHSPKAPEVPGVLDMGAWGDPAKPFQPLPVYDAISQLISPYIFSTPAEMLGDQRVQQVGKGDMALHPEWFRQASRSPPQLPVVASFNIAINGYSYTPRLLHIDFNLSAGLVRMAPNVTVTLRALTLMNLGSARGAWGPGVVGVSPPGLANFTCLLWFFDGNRSPNASRPLVYLEHVTLLLPHDELAVLRGLRAAAGGPGNLTSTSADAAAAARVDPQAAALLKQQLQGLAAQTLANGSLAFPGDVKLLGIWARNLTLRALPEPGSPEAAALPFALRPVNWSVLQLAASHDQPSPSGGVKAPYPARTSNRKGTEAWVIAVAVVAAVVGVASCITMAVVGIGVQRDRRKAYTAAAAASEQPSKSQAEEPPSEGDVSIMVLPAEPKASDESIRALERRNKNKAASKGTPNGCKEDTLAATSIWKDSEVTTSNETAALNKQSSSDTSLPAGLELGLQGEDGAPGHISAPTPAPPILAPAPQAASPEAEKQQAVPAGDSNQTAATPEPALAPALAPAPAQAGDKNRLESPGRKLPENPHIELAHALNVVKNSLAEWQVDVVSVLGSGSYGVVYKGWWRGIEVAVKRLLIQQMAGPKGDVARHMALQEAALTVSLNHPNCVATYTYDLQPLNLPTSGEGSEGPGGHTHIQTGVQDWNLLLIQEFCDGGSLLEALDMKRFHVSSAGQSRATQAAGSSISSISESSSSGPSALAALQSPFQPNLCFILCIATNIAAGMTYLHSKNIIHGDLKPDNILLRNDPSVLQGAVAKISDFGLSKLMPANRTHLSGVRHGTPLYIAPEVLKHEKVSPSSDVYSFGVMLWELWHGCTAWDHLIRTAPHLANLARSGTIWAPCTLLNMQGVTHEAYKALCSACLSMDSAARPKFNEVFMQLSMMLTEEIGKSSSSSSTSSTSTSPDSGPGPSRPDLEQFQLLSMANMEEAG